MSRSSSPSSPPLSPPLSATGTTISIRIAPGEVIDRLTILEIKAERISDPAKLANIRHELEDLAASAAAALPEDGQLDALRASLKRINETLWVIEDDIRDLEREKDFGARFIELARAVYHTNDERARIKRAINEHLGSDLIEEKSYSAY